MINWPIHIVENKYLRWYEILVQRAQLRQPLEGYVEHHHIIPVCFKKTNDCVTLTAREHYIAHLLLWKMDMETKNHNKMTMALNIMVNGSGNKLQDRKYIINSKIYENHRKAYSKLLSETRKGSGNSFYGKKHSPETIAKIVKANERTKSIRSIKSSGNNNGMYGKKHSLEKRLEIGDKVRIALTSEIKAARALKLKEHWADPTTKKQKLAKRHASPGWINRDWKAIGRKSAASRKARGFVMSAEQKLKLSETRRQKLASGEIIPWNKGLKGLKGQGAGHIHEKKECQHCAKLIPINVFARWHGEKCKQA